MPSNKDLLENCPDTLGVPGTTATVGVSEEASFSFNNSGTTGDVVEGNNLAVCEDTVMKLKNLESEAVQIAARLNVNINVNKQEDVGKLTEKCLNNSIESPVVTSVRLATDIKSNILKAQVEASHKVTREDSMSGDKNPNVQDAATRSILMGTEAQGSPPAARRQEMQETREQPKHLSTSNVLLPNVQNEDIPSIVPEATLNPVDDAPALKRTLQGLCYSQSGPNELDSLLASLTENLIDFTDAVPQVPSYSSITPRWIVPSGAISNGILGSVTLPAKVPNTADTFSALLASPPLQTLIEGVVSTVNQLNEQPAKPKCLLTTEL